MFKYEFKCSAFDNRSSTACSFAVVANELHICTVILCNTAGYQVCSKTVALYPGHVARALRVLPLPLLYSRWSRAIARFTSSALLCEIHEFSKLCSTLQHKLLRAQRSFWNCIHTCTRVHTYARALISRWQIPISHE